MLTRKIFRAMVFVFLTDSHIVRLISFFRPHRFMIRFYRSTFFISRILPKYPVLKIVNGYGRGLKISLSTKNKQDSSEVYYWLGFHEQNIQRLFHREIKAGFIIYDVGANIGFFSLIGCRLAGPKGKVFAFEPLPDNIERIKQNVLLNKMQSTVFCIGKVVTDRSGRGRLLSFGRNDWVHFCNSDDANSPFETISLDDFIFKESYPAPNLIKIDVEGGEDKVLAGAKRVLKEFKPVIIVELHTLEAAKCVFDILVNFRYRFEDSKGLKIDSILNQNHILARPIKMI
ncbi:MAG: FkbM family methyltransferase [Candidatus Omnitrophica bacterium]|nr:FkbM family methyltransferase [Candidatus Omnitrophota bacterium]